MSRANRGHELPNLFIGDIERADIKFAGPTINGATWYEGTTGSPSGTQIDRLSVAVHEFGHAVALSHTSQSSSDVMWPYINAGETKRYLSAHDKAGIKQIYPAH